MRGTSTGRVRSHEPIDTVDSVELIEKGPLRACDSRIARLANSKFVQDITLYAGADQVECGERHRLA